ncbi:ABC transporter substrate-binding protein [Streptomyces sp. M19]
MQRRGRRLQDELTQPAMKVQGVTIGTAADSAGPAKDLPGAKRAARSMCCNATPWSTWTRPDLRLQRADHADALQPVADQLRDRRQDRQGQAGRRPRHRHRQVLRRRPDLDLHPQGGLKFEDGTPITSADVRQSVERLYAPFETNGPTYLQQWLSGDGQTYRKALPDGPYKGKHLPSSVLDTPDDRTVVFHFDRPRAEVPFSVAMPAIGAVPPEKDTKEKYDKKPVASGPYKIAEFKPGKSMTFVRNDQWDPRTDAIHHQYVDRFEVSFGHQWVDSTRRLQAADGSDRTAMTWTNVVDPRRSPRC